MPGYAGHQDGVARLAEAGLRADHARDQPEIGGEAVVEAVDDVPKDPPGPVPVPWLGPRPGQRGQAVGVLLGLPGELERRGASRAFRLVPVQVQVPFDLPALLPEEERAGGAGPRTGGPPTPGTGLRPTATGSGAACPCSARRARQAADVPVLDPGELPVDLPALRVGLRARPAPDRESGVGFVLEVVEPGGGAGDMRVSYPDERMSR